MINAGIKIIFRRAALYAVVFVFAFSFLNIQKAKAIVPVYDAALFGLLTETQATIIMNQEIQIKQLTAIATAEAGQYQKNVSFPPPVLLPYMPGNIASAPVSCTNFDCWAWMIAKIIVHNLSQQIISWIRTGNLGGNPLQVMDWENFLLSAVNQASGYFIQELNLTQLCAPFELQVKLGLTRGIAGNGGRGIPYNMRAKCTITDAINNLQNFYNNFANGGWDRWIQVSQEPANNPYMSFIMGIEALENRRKIAVKKNLFEGLSSDGLLGQKKCQPATIETEPGDVPLGETCTIVTPGKAVEEELAAVLGENIEQLNLADELDEILMAILQTLLQNVLLSAGGVLSGNLGNDADAPPQLELPGDGGPIPTGIPPPGGSGGKSGTITVTDSTYAASCGVPTQVGSIANQCNGQQSCNYQMHVFTDPGDVAPGCAKDLSVSYSCSGGGSDSIYVAPEAGFSLISLSCQ